MFVDFVYLYFFFIILVLFFFIRSVKVSFYFFLSNVVLMFFFINNCIVLSSFFSFYVSFIWVSIILYIGLSHKQSQSLGGFSMSLFFIYCGGLIILSNNNLVSLVIGFEFMLLSSLFLLKITSKSDRSLEAIVEMFVWSIFGSLFLFLGLILNSFNTLHLFSVETLCIFFFILGFGVKVPLWPFTSWLLKAHVEASTEFSIFLSGFLVKFGVLGLYNVYSHFNNNFYFFYILSFIATVGVIDATIRLFSQVDLKRIVALTTVIETNWLVFCLSCNTNTLNQVATWLIVIHCFTTTLEFYFVEMVYRRYGSRNLLNIFSLAYNYPSLYKVFMFTTFTTVGLPGTSIFIAKLAFFVSLSSFDLLSSLLFAFIFLVILPVFFIRLFLTISGGSISLKNSSYFDLNQKDIFILLTSIVFTIIFGFYPSIIA